MQIIDSHAHFGKLPDNPDRPAAHYSALTVPVEELLRAADEAGVAKLIQVVPTVMGYDNAYSIGIAKQHADRIRTFARFDPTLPDIAGRLRALMRDHFVLGVRLWGVNPREQNWIADGAFEPFWPAAQALKVPVALYAPNQAPLIGDIARRFPELILMLDHALVRVFETERGPDPFAGWPDVLGLARYPNVHIKASGLPEATNEKFPFPQAAQRLRELRDGFGADRLLWGSNFPHVRRVCSYREAVDFVRTGCEFLSASEREGILGANLMRLLQLSW